MKRESRQDFLYPGAKLYYKKQMHSAQRDVECRHCHKVFAKGLALLLQFGTTLMRQAESIQQFGRASASEGYAGGAARVHGS